MGIVLDRAVPDVSRTASRASSSPSSSARIGRGALGNKSASGTEIIDELGRRAHADRRADRLHVGRQRVSDRGARRRRPGARAVSRVRDRVRAGRRRAGRRPRHRAAVRRRAGRFTRTANRRDYALPPLGRDAARSRSRRAGCRSSRSARSRICSPAAASRARSTPRATTRAWTRCERRWRRTPRGLIFANLVDFDTQYGHRNDVAGLRREPRAVRRAAGRAAAAAAGRRPARRHRRPRQRSDDAEHRSLARVRAAAGRGRAACAPASTSARARRSPTSARRWPSCSASGRCAHGTSFLAEILRE